MVPFEADFLLPEQLSHNHFRRHETRRLAIQGTGYRELLAGEVSNLPLWEGGSNPDPS